MKSRIVSGILLIGAFLAVVAFLPTPGCWAVLVFVSCASQWEAYKIIEKTGVQVFKIVGLLCGSLVISIPFVFLWARGGDPSVGHEVESLAILTSIAVILLRQFPQKFNERPLSTVAFTLFGVMYTPFLLNHFTKIAFLNGAGPERGIGADGRWLIVYSVLVVKSADMGAYFVGTRFGRHRIFKRLSPAKTWEGLGGGLVAAVLISFLFWLAVARSISGLNMDVLDSILLGFLLTGAGLLGDLFESLLKRSGGVKDSGSAVPGLGGILDTIDSLLLGAPALYFYARVFMR